MPDAFRPWAGMARRRRRGWETGCLQPAACDVYATHRPSGEKLALGDSCDTTLPNGSAFRPRSVNTQSENVGPLRTENSRRVPSRDQDSGRCSSSFAGSVRRSAVPPSTDCHQSARSPSRADWKVTRRLSADHTGKRLPPVNVSRLICVCSDRSVRPDVRRLTLAPANGEQPAVWRDPGMDIDSRWNLQRHDCTSPVAEDQTARRQRDRGGTRHVRERAGPGDRELRRAGLRAESALNACDDRDRLSRDRERAHVERDRVDRAANRVQQVTAWHVPAIRTTLDQYATGAVRQRIGNDLGVVPPVIGHVLRHRQEQESARPAASEGHGRPRSLRPRRLARARRRLDSHARSPHRTPARRSRCHPCPS